MKSVRLSPLLLSAPFDTAAGTQPEFTLRPGDLVTRLAVRSVSQSNITADIAGSQLIVQLFARTPGPTPVAPTAFDDLIIPGQRGTGTQLGFPSATHVVDPAGGTGQAVFNFFVDCWHVVSAIRPIINALLSFSGEGETIGTALLTVLRPSHSVGR